MFVTVKSFPVGTIVKPIMDRHVDSCYANLRVAITRGLVEGDISQFGIVIREPDRVGAWSVFKFGAPAWIELTRWETA